MTLHESKGGFFVPLAEFKQVCDERDSLRGSWDALATQQRLNEQVQRENRELRGLLDTVVDAMECGGFPLSEAWWTKTKEVLK